MLLSKVVEIVALIIAIVNFVYGLRMFYLYHQNRNRAEFWQGILSFCIVVVVLVNYFAGIYKYPFSNK